jgi:protein involved in polysaccharide export with SLBB domain
MAFAIASLAPCAGQAQGLALEASKMGSSATALEQHADVGGYLLDQGDRLRLRFFDHHNRDDLNGEYMVSDLGQIRLPRIGFFDARGKTTGELEREMRMVAASRGQKLGNFSVEILERRPFYVLGWANRPGAYPYLPGMTVLHAVAIAGGLYRSTLTLADGMREKSKVTEAIGRLKELAAKRARIQAEKDSSLTIEIPDELLELDPDGAKAIIDREAEILARQMDMAAREKASLERIIEITQREIKNLQSEIETISRQRGGRDQLLEQMKKMFDRGLANQQRYTDTQMARESLERDVQTALAQMSRAQASLEKAERDLSMLTLEKAARILRERASVELDISKVKATIEESRKFISGIKSMAQEEDEDSRVTFKIMRLDNSGQYSLVDARETTQVKPGDVIKIESPKSNSAMR